MSEKAISAKKTLVQEVAESLKAAKSFVVFEYLGLTASQMTNLRAELHKNGGKLCVLKNNILDRAIQSSGIIGFENLITGPNAIAVGFEDEITPFKAISEVSKQAEVVKVKGAYLENAFVDTNKFKEIASIPGREGLYSMFLSCLQSPIRSFLYALKAVSETKN